MWQHKKAHIFGLLRAIDLKFYRKVEPVSTRPECNMSVRILWNQELQLLLYMKAKIQSWQNFKISKKSIFLSYKKFSPDIDRKEIGRGIDFWHFQSDYSLVFSLKWPFCLEIWIYPVQIWAINLRCDNTKKLISSDCWELSTWNFTGR